jgi:hypothetical protein
VTRCPFAEQLVEVPHRAEESEEGGLPDGLGRPYRRSAVLAGGKLETRQQTMGVKNGLI